MQADDSDPWVRNLGRSLIVGINVGVAGLFLYVGASAWEIWPDWQRHRAQATVALRALEDEFARPDPVLGWKHVPGARVEAPFLGDGVEFAFNSQGLRAERDYTEAIPQGRHRIVAVGDSFTFGNTRFEDTWPQRLEAALSDVEVLNMGASAYGVDQMWLWYQQDGVAFDTDLVILALIDEDLRRATLTRWVSGYGRPRFVLEDDALVLTNVPVPERIPAGEPIIEPYGFVGYLATYLVRGRVPPPDPQIPHRIIKDFASFLRSRGDGFLVVFLPRGGRNGDEPRRRLESFCAAEQIPFLDLTPVFHEAQGGDTSALQERWLLPDGHYNPAGNALVADAVASHLAATDPRLWTARDPDR